MSTHVGGETDVTVPRRHAVPLNRWVAVVAVGSVIGMLPWIVYLGFTLPAREHTTHYGLAWVGFDVGMWLVMVAFAAAALRRHPLVGPIAAVAAMMLVVDAWFDVSTSDGGGLTLALVLAFCAELPFAVLCACIAVRSERARLRAFRRLHEQWAAMTAATGPRGQARDSTAAMIARTPAPVPPLGV